MSEPNSKVIKCKEFNWESVEKHQYKTSGTGFKDIHRFSLLSGKYHELNFHTRYFEIAPEGYSSLEYHRHPHSVVIIRGTGSVVIDNTICDLGLHDVVYISPGAIHQFLADKGDFLGFLCMVDRYRDKPVVPDEQQLQSVITDQSVLAKIKI